MTNKNYYEERVNRVLDYVTQHLDGDLSLNRLARVSHFSAFHFHRIFHAITGETLNSFVRRARLERAAQLMKAAPARRITDIALDVGFPGLAEFSRAFKAHFGITASSWDRRAPLEKSKICKAPDGLMFYPLDELERRVKSEGLRVRIGKLDRCRYVYIRTFDPYGNQRLIGVYHSLLNWLAQRQTDLNDVVMIGMSQDDPAITPAEKCRYDMGVAFPKGAEDRGIVGEILRSRRRAGRSLSMPDRAECEPLGLTARDFEAEALAVIHCVGDLSVVSCAWQHLFRVWLPASGYQPANAPAFEVFARTPEEIGWETFDLYACLPIVRL
ncbi:MAG TPA: helix-turn-helix domain-containing protein [Blastocatellia bacterium]|nr:helix-turn-helix domain-containing protein [Blastocatellia bacterium]